MRTCFFGENGLTSTSANHIANVAKEMYKEIEGKIKKLTVKSTTVSTFEGNKRELTKGSTPEELVSIIDDLKTIAELNSLIAWLREGIKEKESEVERICSYTFIEYLDDNDIELVESKTPDYLTEKEFYEKLSIKEYAEYLSDEAYAAAIGNVIHKDGALSDAREMLVSVMKKPCRVEGEDKNALIYECTPSVDFDELNEIFFKLQKEHRAYQARINKVKFECEEFLRQDKITKNAEFEKLISQNETERSKIRNQYDSWKQNKLKEISKLKIIIPNMLEKIYEEVKNM